MFSFAIGDFAIAFVSVAKPCAAVTYHLVRKCFAIDDSRVELGIRDVYANRGTC